MLKILTGALVVLVCGAQIPCLADEGLGKQLLRQVVDTGKSHVDKSLDKTAGKITGTGAGTASTTASKAAGATEKAGATAEKAGTKAGTSAAATTTKPTEKPKTLTEQAQDAAKKYGDHYVNKGQQELTKLMIPKKGK